MFNSTDFEYDGTLGSAMGLWLCRTDEQSSIPFGINRKIVEDQNKRNFYFYRTDDQPLSFSLTFKDSIFFSCSLSTYKTSITKELNIAYMLLSNSTL
jgi:hypothetical protein